MKAQEACPQPRSTRNLLSLPLITNSWLGSADAKLKEAQNEEEDMDVEKEAHECRSKLQA